MDKWKKIQQLCIYLESGSVSLDSEVTCTKEGFDVTFIRSISEDDYYAKVVFLPYEKFFESEFTHTQHIIDVAIRKLILRTLPRFMLDDED